MDPWFVILMFAALMIGMLSHSKQVSNVERSWGQYAQDRDLRFVAKDFFTEPEISGRIDGRLVRVSVVKRGGKNKTTYTRATLTTLRAMPQDLAVAQEGLLDAFSKLAGGQDIEIGQTTLDKKLRFRGASESSVVSLFADDALQDALQVLNNYSHFSRLKGNEVIVEQRGLMTDSIDVLVNDALNIAAVMEAARVRPWQDAANVLKLSLREQNDRLILSGEHRTHAIEIATDLKQDTTTITLPLSGMPAGLSVTAGSEAAGLTLGDPILDGMVTVSGNNPDAVRMLLKDDELRGVLLAVVHAWPGSSVTASRIRLALPTTDTTDLPARLEEVTTLASRLMRPDWYAPSGQRAAQRRTETT